MTGSGPTADVGQTLSQTEPPEAAHPRYPGTRSFSDDEVDAKLYFGRDNETLALLDRVRANRLLVLFGKSGLGKTSLLQAGLFPRLRQLALLPIPVRLNQTDADPVATIIAAVQAACAAHGVDCQPGERQGLWSFFKTTDLWRGETLLTPVLVLDQFEEIFTLQDASFRQRLASELGDLSRPGLPVAWRQRRAKEGRLPFSDAMPELRVVLSLREEWVGALEDLVADLPGVFDQRFQLAPLDLERARRAVVAPAAVVDGMLFRSRPFRYQEQTLDTMMTFLANRHGEVEPFQLQVLCQHIEQQVLKRQASSDTEVEVDNDVLGGQEAMAVVQANFYKHALLHLSGWYQRRRAQLLCERGLLSPDGRRVSLEEGTIFRKFKLNPVSLTTLVETRLVRRDTRPGLDGFYYELSHDSLMAPVLMGGRWRLARQTALVAGLLLLTLGPVIWLQYQGAQEQEVEIATSVQSTRNVQRVVQAYVEKQFFRSPLKSGGEGPEMVPIPIGEFSMGSPETEAGREDDEQQHAVTLTRDFALGVREVTRGEFGRFVEATRYRTDAEQNAGGDEGCYSWNEKEKGWGYVAGRSWRNPGFEQTDDSPVVCVSWNDAMAYTRWLSEQTGKPYRLPTEAEWEYAARAGTTTARYWGKTAAAACEFANVRDRTAQAQFKWSDDTIHACADGFITTAPVGTFKPNAFGLLDILGNAWEWTCSAYGNPYGGAELKCGGDAERRVLRGGSWSNTPLYVRSANRFRSEPVNRYNLIGFRLAQDL